jgi:hypothetical protein
VLRPGPAGSRQSDSSPCPDPRNRRPTAGQKKFVAPKSRIPLAGSKKKREIRDAFRLPCSEASPFSRPPLAPGASRRADGMRISHAVIGVTVFGPAKSAASATGVGGWGAVFQVQRVRPVAARGAPSGHSDDLNHCEAGRFNWAAKEAELVTRARVLAFDYKAI